MTLRVAKNFITRNSLDAATLPYNMTQKEYDEYSKEWEEWSAKQGEWPYTPTDPLLDQQAKNSPKPQPSLHRLVA